MKIMEKSKHFHYQSLRNSSYNTFIFCSLGIIYKKDCGNVTPPLYIHIKVPHVIQLSTDCVLQWTLKSSLKIIISILFLVIVTHNTLKFSHETLAVFWMVWGILFTLKISLKRAKEKIASLPTLHIAVWGWKPWNCAHILWLGGDTSKSF